MNPVIIGNGTLYLGDCIEVMRAMSDSSVDAVVTDPPYGIRFMGKAWDGADIDARAAARRKSNSHCSGTGPNGEHKSIAAEAGKYDLAPAAMKAFQEFSQEWAAEALRVLKPGGHLLTFSSARTYHRMTSGIEDAGFEIRDQIMWIYGSGFPKSHNLDGGHTGWGTALKPAHEPICVARKPFVGTVATNVLEYGTGALNIDACRVGTEDTRSPSYKMTIKGIKGGGFASGRMHANKQDGSIIAGSACGRWPANIIHDGSDEVLADFPEAQGQQGRVNGNEPTANGFCGNVKFGGMIGRIQSSEPRIELNKSAARFFYCAKASRSDRNSGFPDPGAQLKHGSTLRDTENLTDRKGNFHPTVKPTDLMAYLIRLVTPPGGTVLDPFMGSGSTGKAAVREGFKFIGIDMNSDYTAIAIARISHELNLLEIKEMDKERQPSLFDEVAA